MKSFVHQVIFVNSKSLKSNTNKLNNLNFINDYMLEKKNRCIFILIIFNWKFAKINTPFFK